MVYKVDDKEVLLAVDYIIKDVDKKFDECLVEKFLEFIQCELGPSKHWIQNSQAILDRLNSFINHKAFVMLNQSRAFKTVYSVLNTRQLSEAEFNHALPLLDSMWNSLGMIIVNKNLSAMTVILSILQQLVLFESGYNWIIENKIESPLRLASDLGYKIKDPPSLARFYIQTSNNYHTRNKAEKFLETLIVQSISRNIPSDHPLTKAIRQTIRDLVLEGSESMVCILINILKDMSKLKIDSELLCEQYGVEEIIQESFLNHIERRETNINNLCKCLALSSSSMNFNYILEKLRSKNHLDGIIVYLSNSRSQDSESILTYLLYPLLTKCSNEETDTLIERLNATSDDREFIDKNLNDRLVTSCLVQMNHVYPSKHFSSKSLVLIKNTLFNYVKCHIEVAQSYKNVMECCCVIDKLHGGIYNMQEESDQGKTDPSVLPLLLSSIDTIHDILEKIHHDSYHKKPILLKLLKMLRFIHRNLVNLPEFTIKTNSDLLRTLELAFKFEDHDIINEFALFFMINPFSFTSEKHHIDRYVELVWTFMYKNAKDTDHPDLLRNIAHLLKDIDDKVPDLILEKHNIRKNSDIPKLLAEMMIPPFQELEDLSTQTDDKLALYSSVDDILNFDLLSDGISDCY